MRRKTSQILVAFTGFLSVLFHSPVLESSAVGGTPLRSAVMDGLAYHPVEPCSLVHTGAVSDSYGANEERTYVFRGPDRDYSANGGSPNGCEIPDLVSDGGVASNEAKALMLSFRTSGHGGRGRVLSWASDSSNKGIPSVAVEYSQSLGITPINTLPVAMCAEESADPCSVGDITVKATEATDLRISIVGYFTVAESGPPGPPGPQGPIGTDTVTTAFCTPDFSQSCGPACANGFVGFGVAPCEVHAEAGSCSLSGEVGFCCICAP